MGRRHWIEGLALLALGCNHSSAPISLTGSWIVSRPFLGAIAFNRDESYQVELAANDALMDGSYTQKGNQVTLVQSGEIVMTYTASSSGGNITLTPVFSSSADVSQDDINNATMILTRASHDEKLTPDTIAKAKQAQAVATVANESQTCEYNVKQLMLGVAMYSEDYDQTLPTDTWQKALLPYVKQTSYFDCPAVVRNGGTDGYAINQSLAGTLTSHVEKPEDAPFIFDSDVPGPNAEALINDLPNPPRHAEGNTVGYLDGHVVAVK